MQTNELQFAKKAYLETVPLEINPPICICVDVCMELIS